MTNSGIKITEEEIKTEAEQRAAEIISRIEFGICKKCGTKDYAKRCIDELNGICPECDKKIKAAAAEELRPVIQSTDIKYKKRRNCRMPYDGKLAATGGN